MKTILCTLFNHFYLDKGLVLYDSLKEVSCDFRLYILCMDDRCYEILKDIGYQEIVPIKLSEFEDKTMLEAKTNRSFGEYCWTCSSSLILYVLEKYNEPICTYIDADMYFYQNPEILIDEMRKEGKTVMITPHRFPPERKHLEVNGIYCVEFNSFVNEDCSLSVLRKWKQDCLNCCTSINDGVHFGDQKYLDVWPEKYPNIVHVCENPGAGIAPWNVEWYCGVKNQNNIVYFKQTGTKIPIVFYHFQHITYISRFVIKTSIQIDKLEIDYSWIHHIYFDYLKKIEEKKQMLELKYGIDYLMKDHPAKRNAGFKRLFKNRIFMWMATRLFPSKYIEEYVIHLL